MSIYVECPEMPNFLSLTSFMSKGRAVERMNQDILESPRLSYFPQCKTGYSVSFWVRFKRLYEQTSLIRIVDIDGAYYLEVSLVITREYSNLTIGHRLGHGGQLDGSSSESEEESGANGQSRQKGRPGLLVEHFLEVSVSGFPPKRIKLSGSGGFEINKLLHLALSHNKQSLSLFLDGKVVVDIRGERMLAYQFLCTKDRYLRFQMQAFDRVISIVHVFEGPLELPGVRRLFN